MPYWRFTAEKLRSPSSPSSAPQQAQGHAQGQAQVHAGDGPVHQAENGHTGHAAHQAACRALHGLMRADQGGQLMTAQGHAGEQGQGIAAEGRHQGRQHQEIPPSSIRRPYSPEKAQGMAKPAAAMAQTSVKVRA